MVYIIDAEPTGLAAIANRLIARVRSSEVAFGSQRLRYAISIGGAMDPGSLSIGGLLSLADRQLCEVKRAGRDHYLFTDTRTRRDREDAPARDAASSAAA